MDNEMSKELVRSIMGFLIGSGKSFHTPEGDAFQKGLAGALRAVGEIDGSEWVMRLHDCLTNEDLAYVLNHAANTDEFTIEANQLPEIVLDDEDREFLDQYGA